MTRRRVLDTPPPPKLQEAFSKFVDDLRAFGPLLDMAAAGQSHADPGVAAIWKGIVDADLPFPVAERTVRQQLKKDPRKNKPRGRPKGKLKPDDKAALVKEAMQRIDEGEDAAEVIKDLAPRVPAMTNNPDSQLREMQKLVKEALDARSAAG